MRGIQLSLAAITAAIVFFIAAPAAGEDSTNDLPEETPKDVEKKEETPPPEKDPPKAEKDPPTTKEDCKGCFDCTPKCEDKACGDDGCGGSCGLCAKGFSCEQRLGVCVLITSNPPPKKKKDKKKKRDKKKKSKKPKAICGNGVVDKGEECDSGTDCLQADCTCFEDLVPDGNGGCQIKPPMCPDGVLDAGEECDGGVACLGGCKCPPAPWVPDDLGGCVQEVPPPIFCGNEIIEDGEECDGDDLGKESCIGLGYADGVLNCSPECTFDTELCPPIPSINEAFAPQCGNEIIEDGEECDGPNAPLCKELGFDYGQTFCSYQCTLISECYMNPTEILVEKWSGLGVHVGFDGRITAIDDNSPGFPEELTTPMRLGFKLGFSHAWEDLGIELEIGAKGYKRRYHSVDPWWASSYLQCSYLFGDDGVGFIGGILEIGGDQSTYTEDEDPLLHLGIGLVGGVTLDFIRIFGFMIIDPYDPDGVYAPSDTLAFGLGLEVYLKL